MQNLIQHIKQKNLGGFDIQKLYAPIYRGNYTKEQILDKNPNYAAVNILIYEKDGELFFPLILRTSNENDKHSGQISLPGGKREENDNNFQHTAIRETEEEIGVASENIDVIRELTPLYIPPSNFYVYTFLSVMKQKTEFKFQPQEVQEIIEFPLSELLNLPDSPVLEILPQTRGMEVPVIIYKSYKIWGATAMILSELKFLLKKD